MVKQSGHRWFTLTFTTINCALDFGVLFVFGLFFVPMLDKFHEDRSTTALVHSLLFGITLSFGVVSGWLISRFGVRNVSLVGAVLVPLGFIVSFFATSIVYIVVCISGLAGIGVSMIYVCCITSSGRLFMGSQKPLALTIVVASTSMAGLIYPYIIQWLMDMYGLNGTFLILGGLYLHSFISPILFSNETRLQLTVTNTLHSNARVIIVEESQPKSGKHGFIKNKCIQLLTMSSSLFTKQYILLLLAASFSLTVLNGFVVVIVEIFVWKGLTVVEATFAFIPFNILGLIGRMLPGLFTLFKLNSFVLAIVICLIGVVGMILLYFTFDYYILLTGCALAGMSIGGLTACMAILLVIIIDEQHLEVGYGILLTQIGILSSMMGPFYGYVRDSTSSYSTVFVFVAVSQCIGALLFLVLTLMREQSTRKLKSKTRAQSIYTITRL